MWKLYDALIDEIPENLIVKYHIAGAHRTLIQTEKNVGLASTIHSNSRPKISSGSLIGKTLKEAATLVKSWNFVEASSGIAAINAYYNDYDILSSHHTVEFDVDAFDGYKSFVKGKKVAVVGHFKSAIPTLSDICDLSIIEREPASGDYPDSASEYLLSDQDFVFITGMTFANKTLPRLLELSKNARVVLMGPSVSLSPILLDFGVECLSGFCVTEHEPCLDAVRGGDIHSFYRYGKKLSCRSFTK